MKNGGKYQVKVTDIKPNIKKFISGRLGEVIRHDIFIEDRAGNTLPCEFISKNEIVTEFVLGVFRWIECKFMEPDKAIIEPCEPPTANGNTPAPHPDTIRRESLPQTYLEAALPDCRNISGSSPAFAMAYAKDLKVAEIATRPAGSRVTTDDVADVIKWATLINTALCANFKNNQ